MTEVRPERNCCTGSVCMGRIGGLSLCAGDFNKRGQGSPENLAMRERHDRLFLRLALPSGR
jgi:hypothetical protein